MSAVAAIEAAIGANVDDWGGRFDLRRNAADLLERYAAGWRYEATHPILFEVSDAGLIQAFRNLLEALSQSLPLLLFLSVPDHPDDGLRALVRSLGAMDRARPLMIVLATPNSMLSLPSESFECATPPPPAESPRSEAVLLELSADVCAAAKIPDIDWLEELLLEVSGAVPIEYLGETAHRVWGSALRELPGSSLSDPRVRRWHVEGIRAAIRSRRRLRAAELLDRLEPWASDANEALITRCLRAQLSAINHEDLAAMESVGALRNLLAQDVYPIMVRVQVLMDLTRLTFQFGPNVIYRDQLCERLLRELEEVVDDPMVSSPLVHRGVEALLTVVAHARNGDTRQRAVDAVRSLLQRALPARLEIAVYRTLVQQQYLVRGTMSDDEAATMLQRAGSLAHRTGDPTHTYELHWLLADINVHQGDPGSANRELYQALKVAEALHWPARMRATIERIEALAGVDADATVR